MLIDDITVGKKIQFNTYGSMGGRTSVIGQVVGENIGSIVPEANKMRAYHASIYQQLPEDIKQVVSQDYRRLKFFTIVTQKQEVVYVAEPWIMESTLQEVSLSSDVINVTNWDKSKITETDLRQLLGQFGIVVTSIVQE
ncbi:hypothetical protein SM033_00205 [Vibrio phage vB_VpaM_sm033]|nr:hypothetical protein SM033_00205 [Vibrio phage vB_VpaM_sm033]